MDFPKLPGPWDLEWEGWRKNNLPSPIPKINLVMNLDTICNSIKIDYLKKEASKPIENINPIVDGLYNLGSSNYRWDKCYADNIYADKMDIGHNLIVGGGSQDEGITISSSCCDTGFLKFSDSILAVDGSISYEHATDKFVISHKSGNSIVIDSDGIHLNGQVYNK